VRQTRPRSYPIPIGNIPDTAVVNINDTAVIKINDTAVIKINDTAVIKINDTLSLILTTPCRNNFLFYSVTLQKKMKRNINIKKQMQ